jgi:hypothetical protein
MEAITGRRKCQSEKSSRYKSIARLFQVFYRHLGLDRGGFGRAGGHVRYSMHIRRAQLNR